MKRRELLERAAQAVAGLAAAVALPVAAAPPTERGQRNDYLVDDGVWFLNEAQAKRYRRGRGCVVAGLGRYKIRMEG